MKSVQPRLIALVFSISFLAGSSAAHAEPKRGFLDFCFEALTTNPFEVVVRGLERGINSYAGWAARPLELTSRPPRPIRTSRVTVGNSSRREAETIFHYPVVLSQLRQGVSSEEWQKLSETFRWDQTESPFHPQALLDFISEGRLKGYSDTSFRALVIALAGRMVWVSVEAGLLESVGALLEHPRVADLAQGDAVFVYAALLKISVSSRSLNEAQRTQIAEDIMRSALKRADGHTVVLLFPLMLKNTRAVLVKLIGESKAKELLEEWGRSSGLSDADRSFVAGVQARME